MPPSPVEILAHILSILATPAHELQYGYSDDVLDALLQLCLSSRTLYALAAPHLYSSVRVDSSSQLSLLHRTLCSSQPIPAIASIALPDFSDSLFPPSSIHLVEIITIISPSVRRIMFDRPLRGFYYENEREEVRQHLRTVMEPLSQLEEFESIQCELFLGVKEPDGALPPDEWHVCWPDWKSLQRLSLYNPMLNEEFSDAIAGLPELTHLAMQHPDFDVDGESNTHLHGFGEESSKLRRVLIISQDGNRGEYFKSQDVKDEAVRIARPGLEIVHIGVHIDEDDEDNCDLHHWVRDRVQDGTLWELSGLVLSVKRSQ